MRCYAGRKVFELMMPDDCAGILVAQLRARHSRITISVSEIDFAGDKHVAPVCTTGRDNERAEDQQLEPAKREPGRALHLA